MTRLHALLLGLAVFATPLTHASAGSNGVVVVVNKARGISALNKSQLSALYKVKTTEFPDGSAAAAVNLPVDNPIRQEFDKAVLNMSPDEAKRFWIDMKIRSGVSAPPKMASAGAVARHVAKTPNAIGYVSESDASGLKIVARIVGGKVFDP